MPENKTVFEKHPKKVLSIFLIIILSLIILLFDFVLSQAFPLWKRLENIRVWEAIKLWQEFDTREKLEVVKDFREKWTKAMPTVFPLDFMSKRLSISFGENEILPLSGPINSFMVYCNEQWYWTTYNSDRYWFNNPDSVWDNPVDTVIIWDSFVLWWCDTTWNIFSDLIRENDRKVINFWTASNWPMLEYATLKEYLPEWDIKNLIWWYYEGNDLNDVTRELKNEILNNYLHDPDFSQYLISNQKEVSDLIITEIEKEIKSYKKKTFNSPHYVTTIIDFIKVRVPALFWKKNYVEDERWGNLKILKKVILMVKEITEKKWWKFVFLYLPEFNRYHSRAYDNSLKEEILTFLKENNIDLIDIESVFSEAWTPKQFFPFWHSWHYNRKWHKTIADNINKFLQ